MRAMSSGASPTMGLPSSRIAPSAGLSAPATVSRVVDFPAPFGPTMQTISPASTRIETPRTAGTRP